MSLTITGNLKGLSPSQIRNIEKIYNRKLNPKEFISVELARELYNVANTVRRRIGILVSREGRVEEVFVGTKDILYLPDLGRYRYGKGRLRRLRFIFSDLSNKPKVEIPADVYGDLEIHRFDLVLAVKQIGNITKCTYTYLNPNLNLVSSNQFPVITQEVPDIGQLSLNFSEFIENLENELTKLPSSLPISNGALLIGVYDRPQAETVERMQELKELARTASVKVLDEFIQRKKPDPKTLIGKGKLEEITLRALRLGAEMLIFDCELRPSQWRAITNSTLMKVIDRSMLILDIFAKRAKTSEGRLQVELAQLKYNLPRLVEKDVGLSRLTGGIGGRGPGETKLEISRRRTRDRINLLEKRIKEIEGQRGLKRSLRVTNQVPVVAIVGYTNVGKSTLFNAMTQSEVLVENKLFATLDTTQRKIVLEYNIESKSKFEILLTDTVGFIRELPKELKSAFSATLEELSQANLILHILDSSDPLVLERYNSVREIIKEIGCQKTTELIVLNKIDKLKKEQINSIKSVFDNSPVLVSAFNKEGVKELKKTIFNSLVN